MVRRLRLGVARGVARTVVLAGVFIAVASCTINPATGQRQLSLIGEQQEIAIGRDADQSIEAAYGIYPDDALQEYVSQLGQRLAAASERPELPWQFRVVDDPTVNAFALPGGFIYVTRGILAHFNSEAELVSVLGHEIGHVTARHSVEQMSQAQLATLGLGIATVASEDFARYAGLAAQGLQLLFLKFSRDDEKQADDLGFRYLVRGGYDPNEMANVFRTLDRVSQAQGAGRMPAWASTHPDPGLRAERITGQIGGLPEDRRQGTVNRDGYLERLAGMVFGDNPREGYAVGNTFYHPDMEFRIAFPAGWSIVNQRQAVAAVNDDRNAVVVLTLAEEASATAAADRFFSDAGITRGSQWRPGHFHFMAAANEQRPDELRGVAGFVEHQGRVFRLLGYTTSGAWSTVGRALQGSVDSFGRLTERRYLDVEPKRLEVVRLDRAMTLEELQRQRPSTVDLDRLAILNGVPADQPLERGTLVKRVIGGELPDA